MNQVKPWQIVLFVAAVLVLGGSFVWSLRTERVKPNEYVTFVDVTTGELLRARITRSMMMPEPRVDNGPGILWPVFRTDEGEWMVNGRHLPSVAERTEGSVNTQHVDLSSGRVSPANSTPARMSLVKR